MMLFIVTAFMTVFSSSLFCNTTSFLNPHEILSQLSLRKKIAQLIIHATISHEAKNKNFVEKWRAWCKGDLRTETVKRFIEEEGIGGIIFFGNESTVADQMALTQELQSLSEVPLLIALDAEWGPHMRCKDGFRFPRNMTIAATKNPEYAYRIGKEIGKQLHAMGVHVNFAPVVDVNNNPHNPVIGMRSFGSNKELVTQMAISYMKGLQEVGIMACAKHFPGHGDTDVDSHKALPVISHTRERLESLELYPFGQMIDAGVQSVMLAHLEVPAFDPGKPSSLSRAIVTDLLQNKMGFTGLIVPDALGMGGVLTYAAPGQVEVATLLAGCDVLLCPSNPLAAINAIEEAVHDGIISEQDINKKVLKVLQLKAEALAHATAAPAHHGDLNSSEALALKKEVYRQAITVVKEEAPLCPPLKKTAIITIAEEPVLFADFLKEGGAATTYALSYAATASEIASLHEKVKDASHVIIGIHHLNIFNQTMADYIELFKIHLNILKRAHKKVTVVLFSSPYTLPLFQDADTLIVAYESDLDAQEGAADVLLGRYAPRGKLPVEIPGLEQYQK